MFTSTSQEFLETNLSSSKRRSKNDLLAIFFFFLGVPHIYNIIQKGSSQRKFLTIQSNNRVYSAQTSHLSRFSLSRYLSILLLGLFTAGIMEMVRAIAK